jgi:hypothetical protein
MFKYDDTIYDSNELQLIRNEIYSSSGYFVVKNFISQQLVFDTTERWLTGDLEYYFDSFHKNVDVNFKTPNYLIKGASEGDRSFCMNIWNPAPDTELNDIVIEANKIRNVIEGRPLFFATRLYDDLVLQYRLSQTVSSGFSVKKHTDLFEEFRPDPAGSHKFDPKRCQMTLFLSDYGKDYCDGGFYFNTNNNKEILFGRDEEVGAGDLVIWKYSNTHRVENVRTINESKGFSRIIFPQFDNMNTKVVNS